MKLNKKVVGITLSAIIITSTVATTTFANDATVNLKGFFSNAIKITNNNKDIKLGLDSSTGQTYKPLVIDGRTYLPIRGLAEALGMSVEWNQMSSTIALHGVSSEDYTNMLYDGFKKDAEINKLNAKVAELEKSLTEAKAQQEKDRDPKTISELEDYLNDEHESISNVDFSIDVNGTTNKIELEISVAKGDSARWGSLSYSNLEKYLKAIVKDIRSFFPKASVSGEINDGKTTDVTFSTNTSGVLRIYSDIHDDDYNYDLSDIEEELTDDYVDREIVYKIELDGDRDEITVTIDVAENKFESYYNSQTKIRAFAKEIADIVKSEYRNATVYIDIIDGNTDLYEYRY